MKAMFSAKMHIIAQTVYKIEYKKSKKASTKINNNDDVQDVV